jgi:predicted HAD superfamily Cof-like phosphohydrolase
VRESMPPAPDSNTTPELPNPRVAVQIVDMVRQFHEYFDIPDRSGPTASVPEALLRVRLMLEETGEYVEAATASDIVGVAHELADIVYVAYGTALAYGIDLDAVIREVHRANMSKLGPDGNPILREDGKVQKGPNYKLPDVARVIGL